MMPQRVAELTGRGGHSGLTGALRPAHRDGEPDPDLGRAEPTDRVKKTTLMVMNSARPLEAASVLAISALVAA